MKQLKINHLKYFKQKTIFVFLIAFFLNNYIVSQSDQINQTRNKIDGVAAVVGDFFSFRF